MTEEMSAFGVIVDSREFSCSGLRTFGEKNMKPAPTASTLAQDKRCFEIGVWVSDAWGYEADRAVRINPSRKEIIAIGRRRTTTPLRHDVNARRAHADCIGSYSIS